MPTRKEKEEYLALLEERERRKKYNQAKKYFPTTGPFCRDKYPIHMKMLAATKTHSELAMVAANRVGKTFLWSYAIRCWATGKYPDWWVGKRWDRPVNIWIASITAQQMKETIQEILFGSFADKGTGLFSKEEISNKEGNIQTWNMPGVPNCVGTVLVNHVSGGTSKIEFKAYEQGWMKFQGAKRDIIWLDEDPGDGKIYSECLARTADPEGDDGVIIVSATPLLGLSEVVLNFLPGGKFPESGEPAEFPHRYVLQATWEDVPHLSKEWKEKTLKSLPEHERAVRAKGLPYLGAGRIFPYLEEDVIVEPFIIPIWWERAYGLDVGWNCTAAVWGARDPESNIIYIYSEHVLGKVLPVVHSAAINERGNYIWGAIDPRGADNRSQQDGTRLIDIYERQGLNLVLADNTLEAGLSKQQQLYETGQLKIFRTCPKTIAEWLIYRRNEDGKIVNKNAFHCMDAVRYLIMTGMDLAEAMPDPDAIDMDDHYFEGSSGRSKVTGY
jgi:phage terminase large subunit-like protein